MKKNRLESQLPDPDMQAAPKALLRAARRARELARQTGTPLVVMRDGKLIDARLDDPRGDAGKDDDD